MLALRHKWIGAILFAALFAFARDPMALQQTGQVMRIELAGTAGSCGMRIRQAVPSRVAVEIIFRWRSPGLNRTTDYIDDEEHVRVAIAAH